MKLTASTNKGKLVRSQAGKIVDGEAAKGQTEGNLTEKPEKKANKT